MTHTASILLGNIPLGKIFFLRLENAILVESSGAIIEIVSDFDNLESEIIAWCRLKGETFLCKKKLKNIFAYYVKKTSNKSFGKPINEIEDFAPKELGLAYRGSICEIGIPQYHFELSTKSHIWSENLAKLYENAKISQWNATNDIDWSEIASYSPPLEMAISQIMTYLIENEFSALYIPSYFLGKISPFYCEIPLFLSSIIGDEARHIEVFYKRAKATGLGVRYSTITTQQSLYTLYREKDYLKSSFLLHVMGEGTFIDLLGFLESYAKDSPTKRLLHLARIDEMRHVAYGLEHIKSAINSNPNKIQLLKEAVFARKHYLDEISGESTLLIEALAIFAGGDSTPNAYKDGFELVEQLKDKMHKNRVQRLMYCGIDEELAEEMSKSHTPNFM